MNENIIHPAPQTVNAYNKVCIEKIVLDLDIFKLEKFLENPKFVSDKMLEAMRKQHKSMLSYSENLSERIKFFLIENPTLVDHEYQDTIGEMFVGRLNLEEGYAITEIKSKVIQLINSVDNLTVDPSRKKSIAYTHVETALLYILSEFK